MPTSVHHEYATLEHLLLSLLDDRDASAVMKACSVDIDELRARITEFLDNELASLFVKGSSEAQPTTGFQRVIHRAVVHVQSSGREEVTAPMCWWPSSPSERRMPPSSCRSRR
jgi:ATP-dependent Clp protease ATP-binding subunit ClpA